MCASKGSAVVNVGGRPSFARASFVLCFLPSRTASPFPFRLGGPATSSGGHRPVDKRSKPKLPKIPREHPFSMIIAGLQEQQSARMALRTPMASDIDSMGALVTIHSFREL